MFDRYQETPEPVQQNDWSWVFTDPVEQQVPGGLIRPFTDLTPHKPDVTALSQQLRPALQACLTGQ